MVESWKVHVTDGWDTRNAGYKHNVLRTRTGEQCAPENGIIPCTSATNVENIEDAEENTPRACPVTPAKRPRLTRTRSAGFGGGQTAESERRCESVLEDGRHDG